MLSCSRNLRHDAGSLRRSSRSTSRSPSLNTVQNHYRCSAGIESSILGNYAKLPTAGREHDILRSSCISSSSQLVKDRTKWQVQWSCCLLAGIRLTVWSWVASLVHGYPTQVLHSVGASKIETYGKELATLVNQTEMTSPMTCACFELRAT